MTKFEVCKKEWLKFEREEKTLISEIKKKIDIVLNQQKEIGNYFLFPRYETFDEVKTHHWFFHRIETKSVLECPCCKSNGIQQFKICVPKNKFYEISECPICGYFSIEPRIPYTNLRSTQFTFSSLRKFNSQLDKYLNE